MIRRFCSGAAVVLLILAGASAHGADAPAAATITVRADRPGKAVNRLVFGHNVEAGDPYGIFGDSHNYGAARTGSGMWDPERRRPVPAVLADSKAVGMGMLRYPGGCLAHNFDWKATIGPVASRPNITFGLDEFLAYCRTAGAEPLITVSDYCGTAQDAADLVEYLNAPADAAAHPWAQRRAENGHPAPYRVRYFEMGNETDHGNHRLKPFRKFTAKEYVAWFHEGARRMRAVDPTIKIGALMGTGTGPLDPWNSAVLAGTKDQIDYVVVHTYAIGIDSDAEAAAHPGERLMRACLAAGDPVERRLGQYRDQIRKYLGRDVPLAITEYNASFVQDKPAPYRFSYGAALFAADYVRVLLKPETSVVMAGYWQFANGYWGMVRGSDHMPAYYLFRLWGRHFGDQLVPVTVDAPRVEFEGLWKRNGEVSVPPARGARYQPAAPLTGDNLVARAPKVKDAAGSGFRVWARADGALTATVSALPKEAYPPLCAAPLAVTGNSDYLVSFEARATGDLKDARLGINVVDARGWNRTRSGVAVEGVESARDWRRFTAVYHTRPDAESVTISWRLVPGSRPITGALEIKELSLVALRPETLPAHPALTAAASRSRDGRTLYLIVFNKSAGRDVDTRISLPGFKARSARRWVVNGPSLETTHLGAKGGRVAEVETGVATPLAPDGWLRHVFPAHSMTAIELYRR